MRYNDIKKRMNGVSPTALTASMKELEQDGIITRKQYAEIPPRVEYTITERGRELWPIIHRLIHWSRGEEFDFDDDLLLKREALRKEN